MKKVGDAIAGALLGALAVMPVAGLGWYFWGHWHAWAVMEIAAAGCCAAFALGEDRPVTEDDYNA